MKKLIVDVRYNLGDFKVEGALLDLIEGVAYIQNFYDEFYPEIENFTQDQVLHALLKVCEIERLRGTSGSISNIDSFVREQVFDILLRERENKNKV